MLIQVNANGLGDEAGGTPAIEEEVRRRLSRFESRLTRVEVHFEDVNGERGGDCDKRCLIELRRADRGQRLFGPGRAVDRRGDGQGGRGAG